MKPQRQSRRGQYGVSWFGSERRRGGDGEAGATIWAAGRCRRPIHPCHPGRCLVSALPVQCEDMLRCKARIQAFGRDLEAAGVMVCTCGPIGLSVFDLVKGLQELSNGWQRKSPRQRQGLDGAVNQETQRSSGASALDATPQLAAETEGCTSTKDGQGARYISEGILSIINRSTAWSVGICDHNLIDGS